MALEVLGVDLRLGLQQLLGHADVAVGDRKHQGTATVVVTSFHGSTGVDEHVDDLRLHIVALALAAQLHRPLRRVVQCGLLRVVEGVDVHLTLAQQVLHNILVAEGRGIDQRGLTPHVAAVQARLAREHAHEARAALGDLDEVIKIARPGAFQQGLHLGATVGDVQVRARVARMFLHLPHQRLAKLRCRTDPTLDERGPDLDSPLVMGPQLDDANAAARLEIRHKRAVQVFTCPDGHQGFDLVLTADLEVHGREVHVWVALHDQRLVDLCLRAHPTL
mmetsp:Transcript_4059/g.15148  ORF Transcript_4059/g.15148 Transcript_4059/m.15148 type:complete len:277 (+) Transcript_4059:2579-3409(+)